MASGIRDLRVWQEAVALAGEVVRTLRPAARREVAPIVTRIMTTAFDAAGAIADGYARHDPGEQRRRYGAARRELVKLDTDLAVARQAELLAAAPHAALSDRIQVVQRILAGYLVYLDRQLELPPGVTRLHPPGAMGGAGGAGSMPAAGGAAAIGSAAGSAAGVPPAGVTARSDSARDLAARPGGVGWGNAQVTPLGGSAPPGTPGAAPSPPLPGQSAGPAPRMAVRETVDEVDGT